MERASIERMLSAVPVFGGGWSGWNRVGGKLVSVAVEADADGRLEVWGVNGNRRIHRRWLTSPGGSWRAWQSMDGQLRP